MPCESFLEKIAKRPDEEKGWVFYQAISILYNYISDEKGIRYEKRDKPRGEEEILQKLGEGEFRIGTAYIVTQKTVVEKDGYAFEWIENPNAFWVYKKK